MRQAVEAARLAAEERATAEILALEEDLEQERVRRPSRCRRSSAASTRPRQGRGTATAPDDDPRGGRRVAARAAETSAASLSRGQGEAGEREGELIAERDQAAEALREAHARVERAEAEAPRPSAARGGRAAGADESELRLAEHTDLLKEQIEALESETEDRVSEAVEDARARPRRRSAGSSEGDREEAEAPSCD